MRKVSTAKRNVKKITVPVTSLFLIKKDKDLKNFVFHNKEYPNGIRVFEQL